MAGIQKTGSPTKVQRQGNDQIYGNGTDNITITTNTTILSDTYYNNLTVNAGVVLNTNGFRVFVKGTLTLNGFIGIGTAPGGVVGPAASTVADGTVKGHTTGAITYRSGGAGGNDPTSTLLPSFLFKSINAMSGGVFTDPTTGLTSINGGGFGGTGAIGASVIPLTNSNTWPGKAGAEGTAGSATGSVNSVPNPYKDNVSVPGGKGATASPGNVTGWTAGTPGAGGSGGLGGGVVCVVARTIVGSGKFISIGSTGGAGNAGTTGNAGTQGADGAKAPDLAYHVAPVANHVAPTHNPSHHHGYARFADFHAHIVNPHPHCCAFHLPAHHNPGHHYGGDKHTPASHGGSNHAAAAHSGGHIHNSGHYHHTGSRHHPHSNDHHGQLTHIHNWPSVIHTNAKTNYADQHSHPATYGHFEGRVYHQHAGGHDGHIHAAQAIPPHTHTYANGSDLGNGTQYGGQGNGMWISGGHHHGPHTYSNGYFTAARHSHHTNLPTHTAQPNGHWTGGAGGVNNGTTFGRGAPASQAPTGSGGGPGGGGAILVVTDSVSGTITYNTGGGSLLVAEGNPAGSGTAYVLINT